jgi:uncharacterized membrane-anchored protein YhcB (DUF1043 family)
LANTILLNPFEILWFKPSTHQKRTCQIKNFIHFLQYIGHKRPFLFSVTEENGQLIENLTLKENLFLEWGENKFHGTIHEGPLAILKKIGNPFLFDLYDLIPNWDSYPSQVDAEIKKMASLFKTLIQDCEYYFFDQPTKHLSEQGKAIFSRALKNQADLSSKLIFIHELESEELDYPSRSQDIKAQGTLAQTTSPTTFEQGEYWPANSELEKVEDEEVDPQTVDSHLKFSLVS